MSRRRPSLVVVAGPNGSGKTTLTNEVLNHHWLDGHEYINADLLARDEFGDWNSAAAVLKAAQRADELREECLHARRDFAFETVFSSEGKARFVERAVKEGYFIRLNFVGTSDPAINISRVAARVAEGGHDVPTDKVVKRYHGSMVNLTRILPLVDRGYVYDNSIDGQAAKRWFRTVEGHVRRMADGEAPKWVEEIRRLAELEAWIDKRR